MSVRVRKKLIDIKPLPTSIKPLPTRRSSSGIVEILKASSDKQASKTRLSNDKKASSDKQASKTRLSNDKKASSDKQASKTRLSNDKKASSDKQASKTRLSNDKKASSGKKASTSEAPSKSNISLINKIKMFLKKQIEKQVVLRERKREEQVVLREQKLEKQRVMREKKLKQENRKKLIVQLMRDDESHTSQEIRDFDANNELTLRRLMSEPVVNDPNRFGDNY